MLALLLLAITSASGAASPDWDLYGEVLSAHVSAGEIGGTPLNIVDYEAVANDPRFTRVVEDIRAFDVRQLESASEHLAFYINAYNVLTIQLILDHWPVDSIRDIRSISRVAGVEQEPACPSSSSSY